MDKIKFYDAQIAELVEQANEITTLTWKRYEYNAYQGIFLAIVNGVRPTDPMKYLSLKERASTILGIDEDDLVIAYHEPTKKLVFYSTKVIRSLNFSASGKTQFTRQDGTKNYKLKHAIVRFDQDEEVRFPTITFERDHEPAF